MQHLFDEVLIGDARPDLVISNEELTTVIEEITSLESLRLELSTRLLAINEDQSLTVKGCKDKVNACRQLMVESGMDTEEISLESIEVKDMRSYSVEAVGGMLRTVGRALLAAIDFLVKLMRNVVKFLGLEAKSLDKTGDIIRKMANSKDGKDAMVNVDISPEYRLYYGDETPYAAAQYHNDLVDYIKAIDSKGVLNFFKGLIEEYVEPLKDYEILDRIAIRRPVAGLMDGPTSEGFQYYEPLMDLTNARKRAQEFAKVSRCTMTRQDAEGYLYFTPEARLWHVGAELRLVHTKIEGTRERDSLYAFTADIHMEPMPELKEPIRRAVAADEFIEWGDSIKALSKQTSTLTHLINDVTNILEGDLRKLLVKNELVEIPANSLAATMYNFPLTFMMKYLVWINNQSKSIMEISKVVVNTVEFSEVG